MSQIIEEGPFEIFEKKFLFQIIKMYTFYHHKNDEENSGKISEKNFADLLIAYAGFQPKKRSKMLRRVKKAFNEGSPGVDLTDYLNFYQAIIGSAFCHH